jgi:hypothetical protein
MFPMKVHTIKILSPIFIIAFTSSVAIFSYISDNLKQTRAELEVFTQARLDNCVINEVISRNYPGGRGKYTLFTVTSNSTYYPIILQTDSKDKYNLFKIGSIISKAENSSLVSITIDNKKFNVELRDPRNEDDRNQVILLPLIIGLVLSIVIISIPNAHFEKLDQK